MRRLISGIRSRRYCRIAECENQHIVGAELCPDHYQEFVAWLYKRETARKTL